MAQSKELETSHYVSQVQMAEHCSFVLSKVVLLLSVSAGTHRCDVSVLSPPRISFKLLFLVKRLINNDKISLFVNTATLP